MIWPGLTDPKGLKAWSSLLDFVEEIGFSRHQAIWGFVEKASLLGKVAGVNPVPTTLMGYVAPMVAEGSSKRLVQSGEGKMGGSTKALRDRPSVDRVGKVGGRGVARGRQGRVGRGGRVEAGKGKGGEAMEDVVGRNMDVSADDIESELNRSAPSSEGSYNSETDGHSEDSEGDDHEQEPKTDTGGDRDLDGDDGAEPMVDTREVNTMNVDIGDSSGRSASRKRREKEQLEPQPTRGKLARTLYNRDLPFNPSGVPSGLIPHAPGLPHPGTMVCSFAIVPSLSRSNLPSN